MSKSSDFSFSAELIKVRVRRNFIDGCHTLVRAGLGRPAVKTFSGCGLRIMVTKKPGSFLKLSGFDERDFFTILIF